MAHQRWVFVLLLLTLVAAVGLTATTRAAPIGDVVPARIEPNATQTEVPSECMAGGQKWVEPARILLGQSADVTMVLTNTCPSIPLPIDLVIIADESFSMTRGQSSGPGIEPTKPPDVTPDPSQPPPTKPPATTNPGVGECKPPPFCGGGISIPTQEPTATNTRRWRTAVPVIPTPVPTAVQEYAGGTDQVAEMKRWVQNFLTNEVIEQDLASGRLKIGFVSFNKRAVVRENLSSDAGDIRSAANRMRGADISRIKEGIREGEKILNGTGARLENGEDGRLRVAMILSDFEFCVSDLQRMSEGIMVMAVGFDVDRCDRDKPQRFATEPQLVFEGGQLKDVIDAYELKLPRTGSPITFNELLVRDELNADMLLDAASLDPPTATVSGQIIEWPITAPSMPITLSYRIRPLVDGLLPVSIHSEAEWTDSVALNGSVSFPDVSIDVVAMTDTPSPTPTDTSTPTYTPTATPTNTPTPAPRYLPVARKNWPPPEPTEKPCVPELQTVDVALVIDTSTSMQNPTQAGGQAKLDAAIEAARVLVTLLKPGDQTAVVGFNAEATLVLPLSADAAAINDALSRLPDTQAVGTSIYRGLETARDELVGPRHKSENNRSIVLVTDGQHNDPEHGLDAVRQLADEIRAEDIEIVTVGLGDDIDESLLRDIATTPEYFFRAPDASDLLDIYTEIAHLIPCP